MEELTPRPDSNSKESSEILLFEALFKSMSPLADPDVERELEKKRRDLFIDIIISFYQQWLKRQSHTSEYPTNDKSPAETLS